MIKAITCLNTILRNLPGFSAKEKPFCTLEQKGLYKNAFLSSFKAERFV
ncbi:hypothetical protein BSI_34630 [Bacillus inaquosorum KCTC 13429]|uniref:Uncharacterized protein n=1 Tax=Bacillus inaquosorum KCTC 13429 TaxID=1236548 RepID=A0A9W5LFW3_9BACI|nr:hypothetical protein BSI_34630 [Bacillus inaquosorum KCTC 13429]